MRRGSPEYHSWVRGFYTDEKNRVRPITRSPHHRRIKRTPSLKLPPPRRIRPVQVKPTVTGHARPKTTLENPMLYRNFMKNLRAKVDPDSWDKVDWEGEVDKSLEVAEAENRLRLKYPSAFKEVERQPSKTEIKEMIVRREAEEKRVEEDLEAAKKHGQIMTPEEVQEREIQTPPLPKIFKIHSDSTFGLGLDDVEEKRHVIVARVKETEGGYFVQAVKIPIFNLDRKEWATYETDYQIARGLDISTYVKGKMSYDEAVKEAFTRATHPVHANKLKDEAGQSYFQLNLVFLDNGCV